jgi:hypothetical protein
MGIQKNMLYNTYWCESVAKTYLSSLTHLHVHKKLHMRACHITGCSLCMNAQKFVQDHIPYSRGLGCLSFSHYFEGDISSFKPKLMQPCLLMKTSNHLQGGPFFPECAACLVTPQPQAFYSSWAMFLANGGGTRHRFVLSTTSSTTFILDWWDQVELAIGMCTRLVQP